MFDEFMQKNNIKYFRIALGTSASNSLEETAVQILKTGLEKVGYGSLETKLARFFLDNHMPTVTGKTSAE